jgi:hypothetical protein
VSKENDVLKNHNSQFDNEHGKVEDDNTRSMQEKKKLQDQQCELTKRLDELKETQRVLELKQKNVESQLEVFIHENERIRHQIL